jgi:hypothetical protein
MARRRWSAVLVVAVGIGGWLPAVVLIWHFAPPLWAWLLGHASTVCVVLAVLMLAVAAFGWPTCKNRRNPPMR